jgi:hypothetical protein
MRLSRRAACIKEKRTVYEVLAGKPAGKTTKI